MAHSYPSLVVAITYTHSAVAVVFEWLADHVADTALMGITHRSVDAADFEFLNYVLGEIHCCAFECCVCTAGWFGFHVR